MDAATKVQITGLLFTLVLPVGVTVAALFGGHRLRPGAPAVALALIAGLATAALGISGAPSPIDADDWLLIGPAVGGLLAIGLDLTGGRLGALRTWIVGALGAALLAFFGWRIAGALAAMWTDGYAPLAGEAWVVDALALALVVWIALHRALPHAEPEAGPPIAPLILGPLALALVGAALTTALTGSARIGQQLGASAAVVGVVGLAGWRWPLRVGHGAVGAAALVLMLGLLYAQLFVEVPRPVATLLMLAPLGALAAVAAGRHLGRTLPAVAIGLGLTAAAVGAAAGLTALNEQAKAAAVEADGGDEDGTYYPY